MFSPSFSAFFSVPRLLCIGRRPASVVFIRDNSVHYYLGTRLASDGASHCTRNATHCKLVPIKHQKTSDERCFQLQAVSDWNALPRTFTSTNNFASFKQHVSKLIFA